MHFRLLYPNQYLGAHDLNGKDVPLTIRRIVMEELKTERGTERKPIVYFLETQKRAEKDRTDEKRLVLNKTNATTIAGMYGPEVNDWSGKRITLYATTVAAFGKEQEAIRVRPTPPAARGDATAPGAGAATAENTTLQTPATPAEAK